MSTSPTFHPPLSRLSDDQYRQFYQAGYLIQPGYYSEKVIERLHAACERLTQRGHRLQPPQSSKRKIQVFDGCTKFVYRSGEATPLLALSHVVGCGSQEPEILKHLRSPETVHTFAHLLQHEQLEHLLCQFHPKLPGSEITFKPHRDIGHRIHYARRANGSWRDINGQGSYVVGIIAIDSMTPRNGGLCLIEGSHREDGVPETLSAPPTDSMESLSKQSGFQALHLEPGDIAFLHPYLIHWSDVNPQTENKRYTLITGYSVFGANPNHNPSDYAGDSARIFLKMNDSGFTTHQRNPHTKK
ncbi:MAG: phytanoyl-CoA dioxygenase family protein [Gammaproteobacteria bacterium]